LAKCPNLKRFSIHGNLIRGFDLSFFQYNSKIWELIFSHNLIRGFNLSPIVSLPLLRYFDLSQNCLKELDLQPFITAQSLDECSLGANPIDKLNISPMFLCSSLRKLFLDSPSNLSYNHPLRHLRDTGHWGPIKKVIFPSPPPSGHHPNLQVFCDFETKVVYDPLFYQVTERSDGHRIFSIKPNL